MSASSPAKPTALARRYAGLHPSEGDDRDWDLEVVSEPFTIACEEVGTALSRLADHARQRQWDLAVGLTERPSATPRAGTC